MTKASGIRKDGMDEDISPKDDLFRHVNGKWLQNSEIPSDKARYGWFAILAEEAELAVKGIAEAAISNKTDPQAEKIGALYQSYMNEAAIESAGSLPIADLLDEADSIQDVNSLFDIFGRFESISIPGIFGGFVDNDPGDPNRYLLFIEQGGIGLPDEQFYRDEHFASILEAYKVHIERTFALIDPENAPTYADLVVDLETKIAKCHWDNVTCRDQTKVYNLTTWSDFKKSILDIDPAVGKAFDSYLLHISEAVERSPEIVVRQPSFHSEVAKLLSEIGIERWKIFLKWNILRSSSAYLSSAFVEEHYDFYSKTLTGTPAIPERWKRAVSLLNGAMGEAVGRIYVQKHFNEESKVAMDRLVANLVEAYQQSITKLNWMSSETKIRAIAKLDQFTPKVGYPKKWRNYDALSITSESLIANIRAIATFNHNREIRKLGSAIDRDEWFMNPQTVNAYYNPGFNEIVFPAAILQFPFFDPNSDDAANYGAIGAVIGHEIGHGFDDQGSKFDGSGKMENWWTDSDRELFDERAKALISQYSELSPAQTPHIKVNGELTVGENIGDLGGLGIAWKAYLISLDGAESPIIDGYNGAQRFFLSWAQAWREKRRNAEMERLIAIDPHSPSEFRCNQIVKNLDAFHDAFETNEDCQMWLDPSQRIQIW